MIKNLLFDLGGVILNIDRTKAVEALKAIGMRDPGDLLGDYGQKGPFLDIELGKITPEQFHAELQPYFETPVSGEAIDEAFCEFLRGIPVERLHELENLKKRGFRIYLLSNTNKVMWDRYILTEFKKEGHDINYYFDGVITSFGVKAYKPDRAIFEAAIERLGIKPQETVFFDDSKANLEGAAKLGFKTEWVKTDVGFMNQIPG